MGWGSFGDSRSYGGSNLGGAAQKRDRDYGGGQSERTKGSRRSDYSFSKVNEWHSSKTRSGSNDRGWSLGSSGSASKTEPKPEPWSLTDTSLKSKTIRSAAAQKAAVQIGGSSIDPYTNTLQAVANTAQRPGPTTFSPGVSQDVPTSADALSDIGMMYTAEAKEEITKDVLNVPGPIGSAAQGLGLLERDPEMLSERGKAARGALRDVAESEVSKRDNLTGSTLGDNILGAAASFVGGPFGGMMARGAVAAGSAAKITDSPFYAGEQVKHEGVADYGEGNSAKAVNPTKLTLPDALKGAKPTSTSVNVVPPTRDNSIGIGTGSLSGRVADFAGSLAIKPKRNGRRGRI